MRPSDRPSMILLLEMVPSPLPLSQLPSKRLPSSARNAPDPVIGTDDTRLQPAHPPTVSLQLQ